MAFVWALSEDTFEQLLGCGGDVQTQEALLGEALGLTSIGSDNPRAVIIFELIFNVVIFSLSLGLNHDQTSMLLQVFEKVFLSCVVTETKSRGEAVELFTAQLKGAMLGDVGSLSVDLVKSAAVFFAQTLAKNLEAYQFVMSETPEERTELRLLSIQTPVPTCLLSPLDSALDKTNASSEMVEGEANEPQVEA